MGSDAPLLLMTPFSRSKQQQQTPYSSIFVTITSQIIPLLHHLEEKALKTSREKTEQHLFPGRAADRSELPAAGTATPGHATARSSRPHRTRGRPHRTRGQPRAGGQPGCCAHPHLECALRPLLRQAADNSLERRESSAINRAFPVPPHAQCHYAALTLSATPRRESTEEANRAGAVLMQLSSAAPERGAGSAGNRRASGLRGPHRHKLPSCFHPHRRALAPCSEPQPGSCAAPAPSL